MRADLMTGGMRLQDAARLASDAKAAGFAGVVFTEAGRTAYLGCAAAALAAPGLDLGTGIAVAFPRSPMVTAKIAWELADATDGHFLLGLGTQVKAHIERRYGAEFDPPGPRLREYVLALRAIFAAFQRTEKLGFDGDFYRLSLLPEAWSPGPIDHPDVPILVAAVNPWMLRMAGEVCDGVHIHPFHSRRYLAEVAERELLAGAAKAGRARSELTVCVPVFAIVGDTPEEQAPWREMARRQIAFYGSTRNYSFMFDLSGFEGTSARLNELMKAGDMKAFSATVTDEMLEHFAVTASWDGLADALVARYGGLADRVIFYGAGGVWQRNPRDFARFGEVARALG